MPEWVQSGTGPPLLALLADELYYRRFCLQAVSQVLQSVGLVDTGPHDVISHTVPYEVGTVGLGHFAEQAVTVRYTSELRAIQGLNIQSCFPLPWAPQRLLPEAAGLAMVVEGLTAVYQPSPPAPVMECPGRCPANQRARELEEVSCHSKAWNDGAW